jgi:DNA ligase-1
VSTLADGDSVEVKGGSGTYTLSRQGDVYACTCPAWRHQNAVIDRRTCKHLRAYLGADVEAKRTGGSAPATPAPGARAQAVKKDTAPPVLLAHKWEVDHDPTGWWMSEKLDGVRAYWDGEAFVSRLGNRFIAPDWFVESLPANTLDGELWVGRKQFPRTMSIVRSGAAGAAWKDVRYVVFDAPDHGGEFEARCAFLRELLAGDLPYARALDHVVCEGFDHLRAELARVEALGGEGLMLRRPRSPYEPGRSSSLLKVKTFHDAEARVIQHVPGAGKHKGRLGALHVELPDGTRFNVGTGFSDAERGSPPALGAIITFRYQELTEDGVPRFPSFVAERFDFAWPGAPSAQAKAAAAATRLVSVEPDRTVETSVVLDGDTVGIRAVETYPSAKAASRAFAELRDALLAQGYQPGKTRRTPDRG